LTFSASSRAAGTCRSVPIRRQAISSIEHTFSTVDDRQDAVVVIGIEPVIGLHRDDIGAKPPRFFHQRAGLDAESLGCVAGGDRAGGIRQRLRLLVMRKGISITVSPADRVRLQSIIRDRNSLQKHVWRARIIVLTADGEGTTAVMRAVGKGKTVVWRWQERFESCSLSQPDTC
jgi:hypothetical protein